MAPPRNQLERPECNDQGTLHVGASPQRTSTDPLTYLQEACQTRKPFPSSELGKPLTDEELRRMIYQPGGYDPDRKLIANLYPAEKIGAAFLRARERLKGDASAEIDAFFSVENLAMMTVILAAWGGAHFIGVGEILDVVLIAMFGKQLLELLFDFVMTAITAKNDDDIDSAAECLNKLFITVGIAVLTGAILKLGARMGMKAPKPLRSGPSAAVPTTVALEAEEAAWLENLGIPNKPPLVRQRLRIALDFFQEHSPMSDSDLRSVLRGIDLSKDVAVEEFAAGTELVAYGNPGKMGSWMANPGTAPEGLGISRGSGPQTRQFMRFRVKKSFKALRSSSAETADTWTKGRREEVAGVTRTRQGSLHVLKDNAGNLIKGEMVRGGGTQYTIPDEVKNSFNPSGSTSPYLESIDSSETATFKPAGQGWHHARGIAVNVDEPLAVGEPGISPQEAMRRAMDLGNRQFLDPMTNQATKGARTEVPIAPRSALPPTSLRQNPGALISRPSLGGIEEWDQFSAEIMQKVGPRLAGKTPNQVRNILNAIIREELKNPATASARIISQTLENQLGKPAKELFSSSGTIYKWDKP